MDHNNSNIPVVKAGDTIYETYDSYGNIHKRRVERITKTQIILDGGTKQRGKIAKIYYDRLVNMVVSDNNLYEEII